MSATLENDFTKTCSIYFEHNVCVGGYSYLLIFGHHINGAFISIPNWKICCEASDLQYQKDYNADKMISAGLDIEVADALASYISTWIDAQREVRNLKLLYSSCYGKIAFIEK